jgi:amino acid transporter
LFSYVGNAWLQSHFGINVPWIWLALLMIFLTSILSYQDVQISAKILGIALILEVVMLLTFDAGVILAKGGTNFSLESLNVAHVMTSTAAQKAGSINIAAGAAAVGVFMAFWSWVGFEMAPNYAEESRDPKRIIPLSLYISVIGLGIFYILTSWCAVSAYPTEGDMLAKAVGDPSNFFLASLERHVGKWAVEAMALLILTSSFACGMAFHNTAARYMYSLGREGVLPRFLGKTHPTHKSPHVASTLQSVLAAVWVSLFAYFVGTNDPNAQAYVTVYTMLAILGTMLLLILQAVVSIAIIVYFRANHPGETNVFGSLIAPIIAFVSQAWLVYLLVQNLETFGGTGSFGSRIPIIAFSILGIGLVWGVVLRFVSPAAHARIGRLVLNDE